MELPTAGWSNKSGTANRSCVCGTWKQHWLNYSNKSWPAECSVSNCSNKPTLGGHIINNSVSGELIAPLCDSCNKLSDKFSLKNRVSLTSANKADTCERK